MWTPLRNDAYDQDIFYSAFLLYVFNALLFLMIRQDNLHGGLNYSSLFSKSSSWENSQQSVASSPVGT